MSEFDKVLHFIAFSTENGDMEWQDFPRHKGWKYYYAEGQLYLLKSPEGWFCLSRGKNPSDALRNSMKKEANDGNDR